MILAPYVLYSISGGYIVLRHIATVSDVPVYARFSGPYLSIDVARARAAHCEEKDV